MKTIIQIKNIKTSRNIFLFMLIIVMCFTTSCSSKLGLVQRKYESGYYSDFAGFNKKNKLFNRDKERQKETSGNLNPNNTFTTENRTEEIEQNIVACNIKNSEDQNKELSDFKERTIIKYPNTHKFKIALSDSIISNKKINKTSNPIEKTIEPLGVVSFILGLIAVIFVLATELWNFTFIIVLLAIILGLISLIRIAINSKKFKGWGWALVGFLIGIIALYTLLWLIAISVSRALSGI